MRLVVAAVGRLKHGPERELAERYRKRAAEAGRSVRAARLDIVEIRESRADDAAAPHARGIDRARQRHPGTAPSW